MKLARRQPMMAAGGVVIFTLGALAAFAPFLNLPDPSMLNFPESRLPPSFSHPLGTTPRGESQLSQIIYGGRVSLQVGFFGVLLGIGTGTLWGLISGYAGGKFDLINQRLVEVVMSTPGLLLAFLLAAVMQPGLTTVIVAIAMTNLGQSARLMRGVALSAKQAEYVTAARVIGARWPRIVLLHVAPTAIAPFLVLFSAQIGFGIITEASLAFMGVGVPPTSPSWGGMLAGVLDIDLSPPWWLVVIPGMTIALVVFAFNLLGDGLRDELDPRLRTAKT